MESTPDTVIGLRLGAQRAGCAVRTLREFVDAGRLAATKDADGRWVFEGATLDALRTQLGLEPVVEATIAADADADALMDDVPEAWDDGDLAPVQSPPLAAWLLAACTEPSDRAPTPARAESPAPRPVLPPIGQPVVGPRWLDMVGVASAPVAVEAAHAQLADRGQVIAQLQAQLHHAQQQLGQIQQHLAQAQQREHQLWAAWRTARIAAVAGHEVMSAMASGAPPEIVAAVHTSAAHALGQLGPDPLRDDRAAYHVAHQAGAYAAHAVMERAEREAQEADALPRTRRGRRLRPVN